MSRAVDHDLAIRFLRAWTAFEAALNEVQAAGVHMDDVRAAASAAMKAAGVEAPAGPPRAQHWATALAEYDAVRKADKALQGWRL